jgi:hypothetical protein
MKRRDFLSGLVAGAAFAGPALAQDYVASVIAQLRTQGFRAVVQERTLLGRVRITATRLDGTREIIINPNNGEILRDLWTPLDGRSPRRDIIDDKSGQGDGGGNSGSGNGNDDDDDESGGEDGGEDGGDNSGSGNGGGEQDDDADDSEDDSEDDGADDSEDDRDG